MDDLPLHLPEVQPVRPGALAAVVGSLAFVAASAYLRDPPWLIRVTSGFTTRREGQRGRPYRWTGGRASFFVPAKARAIRIPLRSPRGDEEPVVVRVDLDDRPSAIAALRDSAWTECRVAIPSATTHGRGVVRVDLRVSPTWGPLSRGVQVGDVAVEPPAR
jgi:hypothetical protein